MKFLFKNDTAAIKHCNALIGRHVVTSAQATANAAVIDLSTDMPVVEGVIFQILRAGNDTTTDADVTYSGGTFTVADGTTYNMTAGDIINYLAFGSLTA